MSDFVTLSCPACGGKLEIAFSTNRFACTHCGNEYIVHRKENIVELEAIGKRITCPIDNHDDMIQKVSAIVSGQTFSVTVMTQESYTYTDSEGKAHTRTSTVPREGTQVSRLAQKLALPSEPTMTRNWGMSVVYILSIAVGFLILYGIAMIFFDNAAAAGGFCWGGAFVVVFGAAFIVDRLTKAKLPQQKAEFEAKHQKWLQAKSKWEKCYYCHRHDIAFVSDTQETVSPDEFHPFLYG